MLTGVQESNENINTLVFFICHRKKHEVYESYRGVFVFCLPSANGCFPVLHFGSHLCELFKIKKGVDK